MTVYLGSAHIDERGKPKCGNSTVGELWKSMSVYAIDYAAT